MLLIVLLLLLVGPFLLLTLLGRWIPSVRISPAKRARIGVTLFFVFAAIGHFIRTEEMSQMLPASVPYRTELIYFTGILELLGAIGIWIPSLTRLTGVCLIIFLLCLLPANIYSALHQVEFGGHDAGPVYLLVRVPFQMFIIWWTYWATARERVTARASAPKARATN